MQVLGAIGPLFGGGITVSYEGSLASAAAHGRVEFVLYTFGEIVMFIVSAKDEDLMEGTAQIMMELYGIIICCLSHFVILL